MPNKRTLNVSYNLHSGPTGCYHALQVLGNKHMFTNVVRKIGLYCVHMK